MYWFDIDTGETTQISKRENKLQSFLGKRNKLETRIEIRLAIINYIIKLKINNYMDMSNYYFKMNTGSIRTTKNGIKYWVH